MKWLNLIGFCTFNITWCTLWFKVTITDKVRNLAVKIYFCTSSSVHIMTCRIMVIKKHFFFKRIKSSTLFWFYRIVIPYLNIFNWKYDIFKCNFYRIYSTTRKIMIILFYFCQMKNIFKHVLDHNYNFTIQ